MNASPLFAILLMSTALSACQLQTNSTLPNITAEHITGTWQCQNDTNTVRLTTEFHANGTVITDTQIELAANDQLSSYSRPYRFQGTWQLKNNILYLTEHMLPHRHLAFSPTASNHSQIQSTSFQSRRMLTHADSNRLEWYEIPNGVPFRCNVLNNK